MMVTQYDANGNIVREYDDPTLDPSPQEIARDARAAKIKAAATTLAALRGQAVALGTTNVATWTQAERRALGNGLVQIIDILAAVGREAFDLDE